MSEITWRRRWKANIDAQPWRPLTGVKGLKDRQMLLIKFFFTNSTYEILVTNMEKVWFDKLEGKEISKKSKVCYHSVYR